VASFFNAEYFLSRVLVQAVRLGLRPKIWLEYQDPMWMTEKNVLLKKASSACQRDQIQRSGNKDGKYSKCLTCGKQWKGDPESNQWVEPLRRERQRPPSLPSPSSSTAAHFLDPRSPAVRMGLPTTSAPKLSILLEKKISKAADKGTRPKASSKRDNRNRRQDQEEEMSDDWDWGLVTPPASANPARTHRDQERPHIMDFGPPAVQ